MANFCPQCGAPAGGAFCSKCGQPMGSAPQQAPAVPVPPPQQAAVVAAPAVAKSSNTLLKVILVVLGLFFVMGVVGMMGVWYVATKVRDKAREYGFNDSVTAMRQGAARSMGESRDGCKLLSPNEAASMLGKTIARTVTATSGEGCSYFAS